MSDGQAGGHGDVSRRSFLSAAGGAALAAGAARPALADEPTTHQATGMKVGETTPHSAIVWCRLTRHGSRNRDGVVFEQPRPKQLARAVTMPVEQIEGACPGMVGRLRVRYGLGPELREVRETPWVDVDAATDFAHRFTLRDLQPDAEYHLRVESTGPDGATRHAPLAGRFSTAPLPESPSDLRFCVMTCQGYPDRGHPDGHGIYPSMLRLAPKFVCMTGDVVYYDNDAPAATNTALARLHWERMFSLPRQVELLRNVGSYWLKDDHDTLRNDSWPGGGNLGTLTFAEGQRIFREQTPLGSAGYRTFRWGRDLQLWLTDGRDFRSPNKQPDGPEKTIWGAEQKAWFKRTIAESDATWKVLVSPTPLVGPDRKNKNDNHANEGFAHEGNELRRWMHEHVPHGFFVVCGDRHWQYHSVDPATGVREFSVGAASDEHAGGSPGENPAYHRFHRVGGGFLSVTLEARGVESAIVCEHRDVAGDVVHEWRSTRRRSEG